MPPPGKNVNGYTNHVDGAAAANGHATDPKGRPDASVDTTSLAIRDRGAKKIEREKRGIKSEGGIELVSPTSQPAFLDSMMTIST